ncbi:restriction endonuclease subunit S [Acinetobacter sp. SK-43]|uniref:restriction endonuclease subunit S n=1 Tax=Acinetobacter sp. SK-43 TaxID=2785295 RepID=UPI00188DC62C|nr:restriction endonuclease subunit S [Acinetobacter sp. SK-43]MBF4454948.1 restriction endonuclease subunit S [Acinetobacter sp. SK-43]
MEFKQYPSYKNSGVEWLGDVPEHWQIVRTKDIFNHRKEEALEDDEIVTAFRDGQVTLRKNRRTDGFTNSIKEHGYQHINSGDLVIHEMDAFAGAIGVSDSSGKSTPVYSVCYAKNENINHHFYSHFFRTMAKTGFINSLAKGIRVRSTEFRWNESRNVYLALPPQIDQQKIVSFLNTETTRIDNLIAKQEKLIELLEEQRKSIISHAVTKGLDPNVPMKDSGVEWLGNVPEHWNISKLRYYLDGIKDGTHGTHVSTTEGELLLSGKNIKNGKLVINDNERKISLEDHQKITANGFPKKGDLLINVVGTIGQSCIYELDTPISFQRSVCFLRANNKLEPNFLQRILESNLSQNQLKILTNKSTIGGVYMGDLVELIIPVVPIKEQNKITDYLDKEIQQIVNCIDKQKLLIEKLKEYRASVISHAVTGKIDIRELVA